MKKKILSFLFLLPICCFSQNLLLNGGFEEENTCTEYQINCSPEAWISNAGVFFNYFKDANRSHGGQHCIGIQAGHTNRPYSRTFFRSQFLCGLRKDASYRLQFFIKSPHPILDSVGVYFGSIDPLMERKPIHLLAPSVFLGSANTFVNDSSWQKVVVNYKAKGDEEFITIANFSRNDIRGSTGIHLVNEFYFFVDDISLEPMNPAERLCENWKDTKENIYDQNERHEFLLRSLKYRRDVASKLPLMPGRISIVDTLILPDIFFATAERDLTPISFALLDSFCRSIKGRVIDSLVVEGHTDNVGNDERNEQLARDRAGAVSSYLRNCAYFFRVPFILRGWGSQRPATNNNTPQNRQRNRRVEMFLYLRE